MGAQFLTSLVLAKIFDAAGFGRWGLMLAIAQWGYTFFVCWTSAALTRYGREEFLETGRLNTTFSSRAILLLPSVTVCALFALAGAPWIAAYIGGSSVAVFLLLVYVLSFTLSETVQYALPAIGRSDLTAAYTAVEKTLVLGLVVLLWFLDRVTPLHALIAFLVPPVLLSLAALFRMRRLVMPWRPDREHLARYWRFCRPVLVTSPLLGIVGWGDLFVIRYYTSFSDVGTYFLAYQFYSALTQICIVLTTVFNPFTVLLIMRNRSDLTDLLVNRMQWVAYVAAVASVFGFTAMAQLFFWYVRPAQVETLMAIWLLLLPGAMVTFMAAPVGPIYSAREDSITPALIVSAMMVVNMGLDILLVPLVGVYGPGIGTTMGAVCLYVGVLWFLRRHGVHSRGIALRTALSFLPSLVLWLIVPTSPYLVVAASTGIAVVAGAVAALQVREVLRVRRSLETAAE